MKQTLALITMIMYVLTASVSFAQNSVYSVSVDESVATVSQRYKGSSEKTVIHIQDAHASLDAQEHMVDVINALVSDGVTNVVAVEGADQKVDLDGYRSFPIVEARDTVAHDFVKRGVFAGVECAGITSKDGFALQGVEDTKLFNRNLESFVQVINKRDDILGALDDIEQALQELKTPIFNDDLATFDAAVVAYERGESEIFSVLEAVFSQISIEDIDPIKFINLVEAHNMVAQQYLYSSDDAQREQQELHARIEEIAGVRDMSEVSDYEKTQYIKNQAIDNGISLKQYPNFHGYCGYLKIRSRIDFSELVTEVSKASLRIRMMLAQTPDEQALVDVWQRLVMLKKVMTLSAERHEAAYVTNRQSKFSPNEFMRIINSLAIRHGLSTQVSIDAALFNAQLDAANTFYLDAARRDTALVENTLAAMEASGSDVSVLVSGGFHSKGVVKQLREKGLNYMVVMPRIDSMEAQVPYVERMTGQLAPTQMQMASFINKLLSASAQNPHIQKDFDAAAQVVSLLENIGDVNAVIDELSNTQEGYASADLLKGIAKQLGDVKMNADEIPENVRTSAEQIIKEYPAVLSALQGYADVMESSTPDTDVAADVEAREEVDGADSIYGDGVVRVDGLSASAEIASIKSVLDQLSQFAGKEYVIDAIREGGEGRTYIVQFTGDWAGEKPVAVKMPSLRVQSMRRWNRALLDHSDVKNGADRTSPKGKVLKTDALPEEHYVGFEIVSDVTLPKDIYTSDEFAVGETSIIIQQFRENTLAEEYERIARISDVAERREALVPVLTALRDFLDAVYRAGFKVQDFEQDNFVYNDGNVELRDIPTIRVTAKMKQDEAFLESIMEVLRDDATALGFLKGDESTAKTDTSRPGVTDTGSQGEYKYAFFVDKALFSQLAVSALPDEVATLVDEAMAITPEALKAHIAEKLGVAENDILIRDDFSSPREEVGVGTDTQVYALHATVHDDGAADATRAYLTEKGFSEGSIVLAEQTRFDTDGTLLIQQPLQHIANRAFGQAIDGFAGEGASRALTTDEYVAVMGDILGNLDNAGQKKIADAVNAVSKLKFFKIAA